MDKAKLRNLYKMVPVLVKANMVNQALHVGRVVASTFEPSAVVRKLLGGVPPAYREKILSTYGDVMLKAFQAGTSASRTPDIAGLGHEESLKKLRAECSLPKEASDGFLKEFKDTVKKYLPALADEAKIMAQVQADLNSAYLDGVVECCREKQTIPTAPPVADDQGTSLTGPGQPFVPGPIAMPGPGVAPTHAAADEEDEAEGKKDEKAEKKPEKKAEKGKDKAPKVAPAPTKIGRPEVLRKLEEYCRLLNDPVAEQVLRMTLGLPMASSSPAPEEATAATVEADEDFEDGGEPPIDGPDQNPEAPISTPETPEMPPKLSSGGTGKVGPYDVEEFKGKVSGILKHHHLSDTNLQVVPVDCIVSGISKLSGDDLANHIARQLGQYDTMVSYLGGVNLEDAKECADMLAEDLTHQMAYPGEFIFLDVDDNYCLCFIYERDKAADIATLTNTITTAAKRKSAEADGLPEGPGGTVSAEDLEEVKAIKAGGYSKPMNYMTFREMKEDAPKMAKYVGQLLTDVRNSRANFNELTGFLNKKMDEAVAIVYGQDAKKAMTGGY